jgi:endonuclease YncB( thermonuclease family)
MIGIDTPESLKSMYMNVAPFGKEAALYTHKRLTKGTRVILIYGKLPYDKFGRELVYIYLPFGEFYNATLVRKGYAFAKEYPPNTKYSKYLNKLSERAKRRKRNMWMVYQEIGILRKDYKHSKQYKKFVAQNPKTDF